MPQQPVCKDIGEQLCTRCGMCCEGFFHSRAILYDQADMDTASRIDAKIINLPDERFPRFTLPCPAFRGACSVYPARPSVCAEHQCELLAAVLAERVSLEDAGQRVVETRELLQEILPPLQELAGDWESHKPEALLHKVLQRQADDSERERFKRRYGKLLAQYGLFVRIRQQHFYPEGDTWNA